MGHLPARGVFLPFFGCPYEKMMLFFCVPELSQTKYYFLSTRPCFVNDVTHDVFQADYSSVGRASDCRLLAQSDGPWLNSGWSDLLDHSPFMHALLCFVDPLNRICDLVWTAKADYGIKIANIRRASAVASGGPDGGGKPEAPKPGSVAALPNKHKLPLPRTWRFFLEWGEQTDRQR